MPGVRADERVGRCNNRSEEGQAAATPGRREHGRVAGVERFKDDRNYIGFEL
jgi:hypothetical protein